jgi:hypothetical protein
MADIPFTNPTPSFSSTNPTGTGTGFNYIGQHGYAYSGNLTVGGAGAVTAIKFNSGSVYIDAKFSPQYNGNNSEDFAYTFKMNGETLFVQVLQDQDNQTFNETSVIIPPHTEIEITIEPVSHTTNRSVSVLLTGRVY